MKNKLRILFLPLTIMTFLLLGIFLVSGCSSSENLKSTPQDKNISTIKTVLKHQFTGPDLKLVELYESGESATVIEKDGKVTLPKSPTKLEKYYKKMFQDYFTEKMYNNFIAAYAFNYQFMANKNGYQIKAGDIDIKEDGTTKEAYKFNVNVFYKKDGMEQKKAVVSGRVNFDKDGKIILIRYLDDGELIKAMNN